MIVEIIIIGYLLFCLFLVLYGAKKGWNHICEQSRKKQVKNGLTLIKGDKDD